AAKKFIKRAFGEEYALSSPRTYKTKTKGAQEAHEAIRPTDPARTLQNLKPFLTPRQAKLYELIWRRFLATQMASAKFDATTIDASAKEYTFRATGSVKKFDGFLKVYPIKTEDVSLPSLVVGDPLRLENLAPNQHFTEPPPRFTEATLVKALEEYGIGRPSTYAPILSTIQERLYVEKDEKKQLAPTEMGKLVNDLLVEHFPQVVDIQFTAKMEEELDEIAEGKTAWQPVVKKFYEPFKENLTKKYAEIKKREIATTPTDIPCDVCGRPMVIRTGRFGRFLACTGYPECKNTKNLNENHTEIPCPKCQEGHLVEKRTKRRKIFYGCSRYPECDFAVWGKPTGEKCPECGSLLVQQSKTTVRCSKCSYKRKAAT
ncbi:type I DNA topoisomerase, partial [Candidatus Azambacteria bacterium]|nr:type I DNA topoisomerase [Candidatus Azambacteria bacterium]